MKKFFKKLWNFVSNTETILGWLGVKGVIGGMLSFIAMQIIAYYEDLPLTANIAFSVAVVVVFITGFVVVREYISKTKNKSEDEPESQKEKKEIKQPKAESEKPDQNFIDMLIIIINNHGIDRKNLGKMMVDLGQDDTSINNTLNSLLHRNMVRHLKKKENNENRYNSTKNGDDYILNHKYSREYKNSKAHLISSSKKNKR